MNRAPGKVPIFIHALVYGPWKVGAIDKRYLK